MGLLIVCEYLFVGNLQFLPPQLQALVHLPFMFLAQIIWDLSKRLGEKPIARIPA